MQQSGYIGIDTLQHNLPYNGGFCKWYYAIREDVAIFPIIDPLTQELVSQPTLKTGATWKGPVKVPNEYVGFIETQKQSVAGIYYEQVVPFHQTGDNRTNRVTIENMPYYQYIIVAKVRSGGFWVILGNEESGLKFSHITDMGKGQQGIGKSEMTFSIKSQFKGLVLPSFQGDNSDSINGYTNTITSNANDVEKIDFTTTDIAPIVTIVWNNSRVNRFGIYPLIEVWSTATGTPILDTASNISTNSSTTPTVFTINRTGADTGFIIIK